MKIYLAHHLPKKINGGKIYWKPQDNWAIEINGQVFYGARSENSLKKAGGLTNQPLVIPYPKPRTK